MAIENKIPDYFGAYIGGACRDAWRVGGLRCEDLAALNEREIRKYVCRDSVWPLPDAIKCVENGALPFVIFWQRRIRRVTKKAPLFRDGDDVLEEAKAYIAGLRKLRELVEAVKTEDDIQDFYPAVRKTRGLEACVSLYELRSTQYELSRLRRKCVSSGFPFNKKAAAKERKTRFLPPQLEHIQREGEDYRGGIDVTPEIWQANFQFRGVEFGNWTSQLDRQVSMNYAFDALLDMARVLGIENADVAFLGKLALAFGSRGHSHTSAHYEPEREVINLTKMRGAGCTAHEWFHAMDDHLAKFCGVDDGALASETKQRSKLPQSFVALVNALKHDSDGNMTDFFRGSKRFDGKFAKEGFGCWASNCEMVARAFACYVKDTLDCASDYLIAHADVYTWEFDDEDVSAIPQGEEREILNELFDAMFYELKEMGFFHDREQQTGEFELPTPDTVVEKVFLKIPKSAAKAARPALRVEMAHETQEDNLASRPLFFDGEVVAQSNTEAKPTVSFCQEEDGQLRFFIAMG